MHFSKLTARARTIYALFAIAVLGVAAGCAGEGTGSGGSATPAFAGTYNGTVTNAKANLVAGDTMTVEFYSNGGGKALFTRTAPTLFSYQAAVSNIKQSDTKFSFTLSGFSAGAGFQSADFTGTPHYANNRLTSITGGTWTAKTANGQTTNGGFSLTFDANAVATDFSGDWSGTITGTTALTQGEQTFPWSGHFTQTNGALTASITSTLSGGDPAQFTGSVAGNSFAGTYTQATPLGDATGAFVAHTTGANSMSGNFQISVLGQVYATGTFTATRAVQPKAGVEFANATVHSENSPLLAKVGGTTIGNIAANSISSLVTAPNGTANITLTRSGHTSAIYNQNFAFSSSFRNVFVAVDDESTDSVEVSQVIYPVTPLASGKANIAVVQGIFSVGTPLDIYIFPSNQSIDTQTAAATNVNYTGNVQKTVDAGQYKIVATSPGVKSDIIAQGTVTAADGAYVIEALVSPPNVAAKYITFNVNVSKASRVATLR